MEIKMAVIGDEGSIMGFRGVGMDVFEVTKGEDLATIMKNLYRQGYGIMFLTEEMTELDPTAMEQYQDEMLPALILIPGRGGIGTTGMDRIHENVERAVGADILNNGQGR